MASKETHVLPESDQSKSITSNVNVYNVRNVVETVHGSRVNERKLEYIQMCRRRLYVEQPERRPRTSMDKKSPIRTIAPILGLMVVESPTP